MVNLAIRSFKLVSVMHDKFKKICLRERTKSDVFKGENSLNYAGNKDIIGRVER